MDETCYMVHVICLQLLKNICFSFTDIEMLKSPHIPSNNKNRPHIPSNNRVTWSDKHIFCCF
jgi:hypothetical protein